ncbi:MAG TPA: hypothetical protein DDX07_05685 [Porphyromonadaceae bacterium]|nr:hypothetical protein [Porphyromonadaceae bacterium]
MFFKLFFCATVCVRTQRRKQQIISKPSNIALFEICLSGHRKKRIKTEQKGTAPGNSKKKDN